MTYEYYNNYTEPATERRKKDLAARLTRKTPLYSMGGNDVRKLSVIKHGTRRKIQRSDGHPRAGPVFGHRQIQNLWIDSPAKNPRLPHRPAIQILQRSDRLLAART